MKLNRQSFLAAVESVLPGVANANEAEQTSCIAFQKDKLFTFNDEVSCTANFKCGFEGAIQAKALLELLRGLKADEIEADVKSGELLVTAKGIKAGLTLEKEIILPIDSIVMPKKWKSLNANFIKAINMVHHCVSTDDSQFVLTCVHVTGDFVETMDNYQLSRYKVHTDIKKPMLIRGSSLRNISAAKVTEFGEAKNWVHFRNEDGLLFSCRRHKDEFPDITKLLKVKGAKAKLPKKMADAIELAAKCAQENDVSDMVQVTLSKNKIEIRGEGAGRWITAHRKTEYKGKKISFKIPPDLLTQIIHKQNDCVLTSDRLKIKLGSMVYVTVLSVVA